MEEENQRRDCGGGNTSVEVLRRPEGDVAADYQLLEDEKIEKFYVLIKNYKEACDRQRIKRKKSSSAEKKFECDGNEDDERWRRNNKKIKIGDLKQRSWILMFKLEAFNIQRPLVNFPAANFDDNVDILQISDEDGSDDVEEFSSPSHDSDEDWG